MKTIKLSTYRYPQLTAIGMLTAREGDDDEPDEKLVKAVNKIVHAALDSRDKRDQPKRAKELSDALAAHSTSLVEQFKALLPKPPEPDPEDKEKGGKGKGTPAGDHPELAKMRAQIESEKTEREKLQKSVESERAKAEAAEARSREQEDAQLVSTLLGEAKVRANLARMAGDDIRRRFITREVTEENGVKTYGPPQWKADDDSMIDPKKGFTKYLATDEGKELLPAVNAGGAGSGRPKGSPGSPGKEFSFEDLGEKVIGGGRR